MTNENGVAKRKHFVYGRSMKEGPDIALLGSLIGDPARANMLTALISGKALTASELAGEANVTLQTASSHLSKMEAGALIHRRKQGRHHYFSLAGEDISAILEAMMGFAAKNGSMRTRTGPKDPALRKSRICYNHLAGEYGVRMFDSLLSNGYLAEQTNELKLTDAGKTYLAEFGIDLDGLEKPRRPVCKSCLDWSARRSHMAGTLGTALLTRMLELKWAVREPDSRVIAFSRRGEDRFLQQFPI